MTFSWYGLIVGLGFVVTLLLLERVLPKRADTKSLDELPLWLGVGALLGARLYHLATDWPLYHQASLWDLLAVWNGGLGWLGALAGGGLGLLLWKQLRRPPWSLTELLDALALALPLAQALGRWGNFANQELFGPPTTLPWGIFIDPSNRPLSFALAERFHPLFLYESLGLILIGVLLLLWRRTQPQPGQIFGAYLFMAALLRFTLEFLRIESAPGVLGLSLAQNVALILSLLGVFLLWHTRRR